jgi:DNA-binding MarR family transcriptional regulator
MEAVPNDRLAHLVRDAAKGLMRSLQTRLARHGVSFGHWVFLRILWEHDGLTQRELSDEAGVMEPTTFAALKSMEQLGYIVRKQREGNKKNIFVYLTPRGRALKPQLVPLAITVNEVAVRRASADDIATARKVLLAMIRNLAEDEACSAEGRKQRTRATGAERKRPRRLDRRPRAS